MRNFSDVDVIPTPTQSHLQLSIKGVNPVSASANVASKGDSSHMACTSSFISVVLEDVLVSSADLSTLWNSRTVALGSSRSDMYCFLSQFGW